MMRNGKRFSQYCDQTLRRESYLSVIYVYCQNVPVCSEFNKHLLIQPHTTPCAANSSRHRSRNIGSNLECGSVLWWMSVHVTTSSLPVVTERPIVNVSRRWNATRRSFNTLRPFSVSGR